MDLFVRKDMAACMETSNLVIIARYKEDISWARELEADIVIYNKGNDWPWEDIPRIDIENYGREGETFVRSIIEFYSNLYDYENIIFLQGNPFEHCKDLLNRIVDHTKNDLSMLTDSYTLDSYPEDIYINNKHISILDRLLNIKSTEFTAIISDHNPNENARVPEHEHTFLFDETMGLCTILGISYESQKVCWSTGGQYIVPVEKILSKSEKWWVDLHHLFEYYSKIKKIESWTYALERIWPLIWEHSDK